MVKDYLIHLSTLWQRRQHDTGGETTFAVWEKEALVSVPRGGGGEGGKDDVNAVIHRISQIYRRSYHFMDSLINFVQTLPRWEHACELSINLQLRPVTDLRDVREIEKIILPVFVIVNLQTRNKIRRKCTVWGKICFTYIYIWKDQFPLYEGGKTKNSIRISTENVSTRKLSVKFFLTQHSRAETQEKERKEKKCMKESMRETSTVYYRSLFTRKVILRKGVMPGNRYRFSIAL